MVGPKPTKRAKALRTERLRQVVWAGLIALALTFLTVLSPVDIFFWIGQSRIAHTEASGQIVYLSSEQDLADPAFPERRRELAQLVERLDEAGVSAVYVDAVFEQPTDTVTDSGLNAIVRVDPQTEEVQTFPLPAESGYANLNTAAFDANGILWFTGQNGIYGRLDPASGAMQVFEAPRGRGPYGITTTPDGSAEKCAVSEEAAKRFTVIPATR